MLSRYLGSLLSRRNFLKGLSLSLMAWQFKPLGAIAAPAQKSRTIPVTDFSGFVTRNVKGFIDTTEEAIQKILQGEIVHPHGTGHSSMGQGLRENAWLFTPPHHEPSFDPETQTVKLSGSTTLYEADVFLSELGYMLPVSPDNRALSVGGVLAVGGFGVESIYYGALVNYITHLDILTTGGDKHLNVPVHLDMCQRILNELGRAGTILSARIKCVKRPDGFYLKDKYYWNYPAYMNGMLSLDPEPEGHPAPELAYSFWYKGEKRRQGVGMIASGYYSDKKDILEEKGLLQDYNFTKDIRVDREKAIQEFSFDPKRKYYVWSDHAIFYDRYLEQAEDTGSVIDRILALGGEVVLYSCPVNISMFKQHEPGMPKHAISMGIYSNFREDQLKEAKEASQLHLDHSRRNLERGGVAYRHAWHVEET